MNKVCLYKIIFLFYFHSFDFCVQALVPTLKPHYPHACRSDWSCIV